MKEKKKGNIIGILIVMAIIIFGVIYGGITLTKNWGKSKETISKENATGKLKKICKDININEVEPRKAPIDLGVKDVKDTIPNIEKYPAKVENTTDSYIEIFSTGEKAGNGKDGWLIDVANNFNESKFEINGKIISVKVREIASGLGMDYIISEKYLPDAYSPSNELWGEMIKANGKTIELCDDRMVGNVAGILISKEKYDELIKKYGAINLKNITQAVANGEINMGYTNPFASATGLNFLVSTLATFDSSNPLSEKAIDGFNEFQNNIPLIAYTTLQLRNSAESGILDGFIMEYQTYINSPELKTNYIFTPFGYRHDSPLYSVGNLSNEKKEILNKFIEFYKQDKYQELAKSLAKEYESKQVQRYNHLQQLRKEYEVYNKMKYRIIKSKPVTSNKQSSVPNARPIAVGESKHTMVINKSASIANRLNKFSRLLSKLSPSNGKDILSSNMRFMDDTKKKPRERKNNGIEI